MSSISQRTCKRCGTTYYGEEVAAMFNQFRKKVNSKEYTSWNSICNACLVTARTQDKEVNRFTSKANNTIRHHAKKFGVSAAELADRFLWDMKRIAHDMEHAWKNGCNDCGYAFQSMPGGLHDLTLDIINPNELPYYGVNTRFVCLTCNRKKSRTPPGLWGAMKAAWARWRKRQEELKSRPKWRQDRLWDDEDEP